MCILFIKRTKPFYFNYKCSNEFEKKRIVVWDIFLKYFISTFACVKI